MSAEDPPIAVVSMVSSPGEKSTPEPVALEQSVSPETEHPHGDHHHHHLTRVNSDAHSETHSTHSEHRKHRPWLLYWASITPLLCGALGPVLTLLALSGCADRWRMYVAPDGSDLFEKDPRWVIGVTALAIIVGLFANILLLLRMLGRGNPKHLQIFAILLWFLECMSLFLSLLLPSSTKFYPFSWPVDCAFLLGEALILAIMNFTTIGIYVEIVGDDGAWQYAQGFWMTVCSAVISTVCALLLSLNSFVLPEFGKRGKMGLSGPQRVFVIQIMLFIFWLAVYTSPLFFFCPFGRCLYT